MIGKVKKCSVYYKKEDMRKYFCFKCSDILFFGKNSTVQEKHHRALISVKCRKCGIFNKIRL